MLQLLAIGIAGALGSVLRFVMVDKIYQWLGTEFPYGVLLVNVLGCFLVGLLATIFINRLDITSIWRAAILIGFLGGFTTFSSFSLDTIQLLSRAAYWLGLVNIFASIFLCLLATFLGILLGRLV